MLYPIINLFFQWKYYKFKEYTIQRQNYILKNVIKYNILKYISISTIPFTILVFFDIGNHTHFIHFIGALYGSCDTVALIKDMPLSISTKTHHTITTFLSIMNTTIDWKQPNTILKLLALYTILSCYSFDVNYCLGMRFISSVEQQKILRKKQNKLIY